MALWGLFGTMLGALFPERRAEALFRGTLGSAVAFAVCSLLPVALVVFGAAHTLGALAEGPMFLRVTQGVIASLAAAAVFAASFASMAQAEGARLREALRAPLFLAWLVPLFLVDLSALEVLSDAPRRAEFLGAAGVILPLLLALTGLEAAAKHGGNMAPRSALLMGLVPVVLAFAVGRVAMTLGGM